MTSTIINYIANFEIKCGSSDGIGFPKYPRLLNVDKIISAMSNQGAYKTAIDIARKFSKDMFQKIY